MATVVSNRTERKQCSAKERRIVILDQDKCKPKSAAFSYLRKHAGGCGKACIEVVGTADAPRIAISEEACGACMLRANRTPGNAVTVVKLPTNLDKNTTHHYGQNQFKLSGLPTPSTGKVLGILGCNGIGKSTAMQILAGKLKPNLGHPADPPSWEQIIRYYRGSALQNYFKRIASEELKAVVKPQRDICHIKPGTGRTVSQALLKNDQRGVVEELCTALDLHHLLDRELDSLSGGEIQRLSIACTAAQQADVYIFDEPSSFLDIKQRLAALDVIRSLRSEHSYVIVAEHDLAILDAVSDQICCFFGEPGAYGVVTPASGPHQAINQFLSGYFPAINMRFRAEPLEFSAPPGGELRESGQGDPLIEYAQRRFLLEDELNRFELEVSPGCVRAAEVLGLLGENGCGKSTWLNSLAEEHQHGTSFKPQVNAGLRECRGTVGALLEHEIGGVLGDRMFGLLVLKPLQIERLMGCEVRRLSGGELQRVAITICLGQPAEVFMLDEPSAGLDCEQRLVVTKVIQRWVTGHLGKAAVVVEHDLLMASSLFSSVTCYTGQPGVKCTAWAPAELMEGLNRFLAVLGVTVREDSATGRPRLNKRNGSKDREQKKAGTYYIPR